MSRVQRWGDGLAVRLPNALAEQLGLHAGTKVALSVEAGALVIRKRVPRATLTNLLAGCRADNRHEAAEWGPPAGREML